nr:hypothetical protein [Tanacetum cinerariifolium]
MSRDTVQLETAVSTISQEYLLEFTSEYGISKALHPKLPGPEDRIVDFPEGKSTGPENQETAAPEVPPPRGQSTRGGKSLAAIELGMGSTRPTLAPQGALADVIDPDPLSFADPQSRPSANVAQSSKGAAAAGDSESENTSFASMVGSPKSIYRPEWGITNDS